MTSNTNRLDGMDMTDELINLLREIRPSFSDVGSRDVDTRRKQNQIDRAIELLSASKPAAPEGWKLVPVKPTHAMLDAGHLKTGTHFQSADVIDAWAAMLAASPAAPSADMQDDARTQDSVTQLAQTERALTDAQRIAIKAALSISEDIENDCHEGSVLSDESIQALRALLTAA